MMYQHCNDPVSEQILIDTLALIGETPLIKYSNCWLVIGTGPDDRNVVLSAIYADMALWHSSQYWQETMPKTDQNKDKFGNIKSFATMTSSECSYSSHADKIRNIIYVKKKQ